MNSVDIKMRIEENLDARDKLLESTANLIADFVLSGAGDRNRKQLTTDIGKLLTGYSEEEKNIIYLKALTIVGKNASGGRSGKGSSNSGSGSASFLRSKM